MSKPKARRPRRPPDQHGTPEQQMDQLLRYQRALRELERNGGVSDPVLAARIRAGWHPGVEMALWSIEPDCPAGIKTVLLKTLLENVEAPKAPQLRLDATGNSADLNVTVVVAPWASAKPPALPAPDETIIEPDAPHNNNTAPSAPMSYERRDRLRTAIENAPETVVYEVPEGPGPQRPVETARISLKSGIVDRLRTAKGIGAGERPETPDATVDGTYNLFGGNKE